MVEIKSKQTEKILYKGKIKLPDSDKSKWYVYILQCNDNSLYTGVTNDLKKRMEAHEAGRGSKYVKAKGFRQLLKFKECLGKSDAQKCECSIKKFNTQSQKLNWFNQN